MGFIRRSLPGSGWSFRGTRQTPAQGAAGAGSYYHRCTVEATDAEKGVPAARRPDLRRLGRSSSCSARADGCRTSGTGPHDYLAGRPPSGRPALVRRGGAASPAWPSRASGGCCRKAGAVHLFLSHLHLDHTVGLTFLPGLWQETPITIHVPERRSPVSPRRRCWTGWSGRPSTPIAWTTSPCRSRCRGSPGEVEVDGRRVVVRSQQHPGGSLAYRLDDVLAFLTDTVYDPRLRRTSPGACGSWSTKRGSAGRGGPGVASRRVCLSHLRGSGRQGRARRRRAGVAAQSPDASPRTLLPRVDAGPGQGDLPPNVPRADGLSRLF